MKSPHKRHKVCTSMLGRFNTPSSPAVQLVSNCWPPYTASVPYPAQERAYRVFLKGAFIPLVQFTVMAGCLIDGNLWFFSAYIRCLLFLSPKLKMGPLPHWDAMTRHLINRADWLTLKSCPDVFKLESGVLHLCCVASFPLVCPPPLFFLKCIILLVNLLDFLCVDPSVFPLSLLAWVPLQLLQNPSGIPPLYLFLDARWSISAS